MMKSFDSLHLLPLVLWTSVNKSSEYKYPSWIPEFKGEKLNQLWMFLAIPLIFTMRENTLPHVAVIMSYLIFTKLCKLLLMNPKQENKDVDLFNSLVLASTLVAIYNEVWGKYSLLYAFLFSGLTVLARKNIPANVFNDWIVISLLFFYTK